MPSTLIESLLRNVNASQLTDVFLIVLVSVFFFSWYWKRNHLHQQFTNYAPTLLTSIGILGTFAGIIIGLLDFDTNDIDGSIGPLLDGLKTAFISSLVGMLLSILYKGIVTTGFLISKQTEIINDDVSSVDFYNVMKAQVESTEQLKKAIAGEEDSSLVSLIKLQRSDANDQYKKVDTHLKLMAESVTKLASQSGEQQEEFKQFQERLWRNLQDFVDMMSKSATEQVVEALKQAISDFNNNLTEQFGDNFKELNVAVTKLVDWQANYKDQLEDMSRQYAQGVEAIAATEASVANISQEAKIILETMSNLKAVVEVNQHQIAELDRHLGAFKDIRDKAVEAVPEIRDQIDQAIQGAKAANDELAKGVLESGKEFQKIILEGATDLKDNVGQATGALSDQATITANSTEAIKDQFTEVISEINNNMRNLIAELQEGGSNLTSSYKEAAEALISENGAMQKSFTDGLSAIQSTLASTIEEQATEHRRQANEVFSGLESTIGNALQNTGESVKKQIEMIDQTQEAEIKKVMEHMASALASITGKFTEDYSSLVEQMNKIVRNQ
jgi:chromosome segregation ATPase